MDETWDEDGGLGAILRDESKRYRHAALVGTPCRIAATALRRTSALLERAAVEIERLRAEAEGRPERGAAVPVVPFVPPVQAGGRTRPA